MAKTKNRASFDDVAVYDEGAGESPQTVQTEEREPEHNGTAELLPSVPAGAVVVKDGVVPGSHMDLTKCRTSLDLGDPSSRFKLFNATGVASIELPDNGEITITASDWLIHHVIQHDEETGEVKEYDRLVIITDDGNTFATTSEVVIARLFQLLSLFDGTHFDGAVKLNIAQRTARRTRRVWQDLRVIC